MSNIASAEVKSYTFQTNVNGAPRKFSFSPTDTIQSMIDTMNTMGKGLGMRSSASCQSIGEDTVYNEGLLFEHSAALMTKPVSDGMLQFIEAVNNAVPLTEDSLRNWLHPSARIEEPAGKHVGLCSCVDFLKEIFETHGQPYLQLRLDSTTDAPAGVHAGTLLVDVSFTPVTIEIRIAYRCVLGLVSQLEFFADPREVTGFGTMSGAISGALEDPWSFHPSDLGLLDDLTLQVPLADELPIETEPNRFPMDVTASLDVAAQQLLFGEVEHHMPSFPQPIPSFPQPMLSHSSLKQEPREELFALDETIVGELSNLVQQGDWLTGVQPTMISAVPLPRKPEPVRIPPVLAVPSEVAVVHREGYMRSKAHEARGTEQDYRCGYCGHARTSASACSDGRVRIRCACGGKHRDAKPRMHANWKLVEPQNKEDNSDTLSAHTSGASELAGVTEKLSLSGLTALLPHNTNDTLRSPDLIPKVEQVIAN